MDTLRSTSSTTAELSNYKITSYDFFSESTQPVLPRSQVVSACIPPATLSIAGHPASPWRRWLSPGIAGKPATKEFDSRWQQTVMDETELDA